MQFYGWLIVRRQLALWSTLIACCIVIVMEFWICLRSRHPKLWNVCVLKTKGIWNNFYLSNGSLFISEWINKEGNKNYRWVLVVFSVYCRKFSTMSCKQSHCTQYTMPAECLCAHKYIVSYINPRKEGRRKKEKNPIKSIKYNWNWLAATQFFGLS